MSIANVDIDDVWHRRALTNIGILRQGRMSITNNTILCM